MDPYTLTHLSDQDLHREMALRAAEERRLQEALIAHIVEAESRQLELHGPGLAATIEELLDDGVASGDAEKALRRVLARLTSENQASEGSDPR